jgi:hypothetical protein
VWEAAGGAAEDALVDRSMFALSRKSYNEFLARLDPPPQPNERLRRSLWTPARPTKNDDGIDPFLSRWMKTMLSFDAAEKAYAVPPTAPLFGEGGIGVYLPVVLSRVPDGMQVTADRAAVEITGDGTSWKSKWDRFGQLISANSQISDPYHQRVTNGPQFLYLRIGQSACKRLTHSSAHLRATVAFTLYGYPSTVRMSQASRFIPGAGFCTVLYQNRALLPSCLNPFEPPQPAVLLWRSSPDERFEFRISFSAPTRDLRTASMLWYSDASLAYAVPAYPSEVYLQVRRPIAYLKRTLDIPAIRLADY